MRWIDRGPEPSGVAGYAAQFTQGWINYFEDNVGSRPEDFRWSNFRPTLGSRSGNICWYCERKCYVDAEYGDRAPTVDHFRPISKYPNLAYNWDNWVFSCRRCDGEKEDGWPEQGYVDPCADEVAERPREYLEYDVATGEIIPRVGLGGDNRLKAVRTINDLGLNKLDVRSNRFYHTQRFISDLSTLPLSDRGDFVAFFTEGFVEYAGVTGMVVRQSPELLQQE